MSWIIRLLSKSKVDPTDVMNQQTIYDLTKPVATMLRELFL